MPVDRSAVFTKYRTRGNGNDALLTRFSPPLLYVWRGRVHQLPDPVDTAIILPSKSTLILLGREVDLTL